MKNIDMKMHVRGKSQYIDDLPTRERLLHGAIFTSPIAKGKLISLDVSKALDAEGVAGVLTAKDIPGINQIGHILKDQPLLAEEDLEFIGQPIALVVAETRKLAYKALNLIKIETEELTPILDPREAYKKRQVFGEPKVMILGNIERTWKKCDFIVEGKVESGGQEHFYLETQSALSEPIEGGSIKVYAGVQSPGTFHQHIADILGLPMHKIELEIRRLGGAFGGKEGCATWTSLSALAAYNLDRPVKIVLSREEDIKTTGKRHPTSTDYKLGLTKDGEIIAYEITIYQDGGCYADLSLPVIGRTLLHVCNSYKVPNFKGTAISCKTNTPANTAFRGFGVPQGVFVMESAIYKAAEVMGIEPTVIQRKNLLIEKDELPYGMKVENCNAELCWNTLDKKYNIKQRIADFNKYNNEHVTTKKGIYTIPLCYGIAFTQVAMNQAGALVHLYLDGSVGISTGAVEMGQGVNMKIKLIAANCFSIAPDRIKIETTNSTRVANASPTSASTGADLNGMATQLACKKLLERLKKVAAEKLNHSDTNKISIRNETIFINDKQTEYTWKQLINDAHMSRTDLSCHAFYAPPGLYFDAATQKGRPYSYHSYGTSVTEVTIDCLTGTYEINSIDVVHDIGKSISIDIDKGQFEGGIIQGIGWATIENLVFDDKTGKLLTGTNSYKIPDIKFMSGKINLDFLKNVNNPYAVNNSKAVGEPPFVHGIGAYFAILNALKAASPKTKDMPSLPITPEKTFMYMYT